MTWGTLTRWLNDLFGGNPLESTSAAVGRKALEGRRLFIVAEAVINLPFAVNQTARYLRIRMETATWLAVSELYVFGT